MSKRQPIEVCVDCHDPFLDLYAIEVGERGRRPHRCSACKRQHDDAQQQAYRDARRAEKNRKNREFMQEYRQRPEIRERDREYSQSEHGRALASKHRAERKQRTYEKPSEIIYRKRVFERDGGRCHLCGKQADAADWHLDHIIPLAKGGTHTYANVAVAHPACNRSKGTRAVNDQLRLIG